MMKIDQAVNKENIKPSTMSTLADVRAKANAFRNQLTEDKFEAAAFKASPRAVLTQHDNVLADMRQAPVCAQCHTTCGYTCKATNVCGHTNR